MIKINIEIYELIMLRGTLSETKNSDRMAKRIPMIRFLGPRHLIRGATKQSAYFSQSNKLHEPSSTMGNLAVKPFPFQLDPRLSLSIRDEIHLLDYLSVKNTAGKALDISSRTEDSHKELDFISLLAK